jgi:starch synthase (maltosyl-transferring)
MVAETRYDAIAPRVFAIDPLRAGRLDGWDRWLDRAVDLGFDHVLSGQMFAGADPSLPEDLDRPLACLRWDGDAPSAMRHFAGACRARGLVPLLDLQLERLSAAATVPEALFRKPPPHAALDPRNTEAGVAVARFDTDGEAVARWWASRLGAWRDAGIAGFRVLSLQTIGAVPLRVLIGAVRSGGPCVFTAQTYGLPPEQVRALEGAGLDFVFSSLPWWDFRAEWLWTEAERLARVAPVMAPVASVADLARRHPAPVYRAEAARQMLRFAAAFGQGWLMPAGFETEVLPGLDLSDEVRAANALPAEVPRLAGAPEALAVQRGAQLTLVNPDLRRPRTLSPGLLVQGAFAAQEDSVTLAPGEVRTLVLHPVTPVMTPPPGDAAAAASAPRIAIEQVTPSVDEGRFPAKTVAGETTRVEADIICDGHEKVAACLLWRAADEAEWHEQRMQLLGNDRWAASITPVRVGAYEFTIEAWRDTFATYRDELQKKAAAGIDVHLELIEGRRLLAALPALADVAASLADAPPVRQLEVLLSPETMEAMAGSDPRPFRMRLDRPRRLDVDRLRGRYASWYEIFPRSMSDDPDRHGTFRDVIRHLPRIRDMGFDVLYFPPIHPIGRTNRKGRNNSLTPAPEDPGSPYAIGSPEGGHDALHPELGTLDDFQALRREAARHGLEIALDFAIQCSPDHPWLREHPDWFDWRPDGTIRYAENPPKKYEDIVNVDFYADGAVPGLWQALCDVVLHWCAQGVRIFRVDNPHTKPLPFWEWMLATVRARHPDALFLSEAFTRPKVMYRLAKLGFSQSYTYFTWRETKTELQDYFTELTTTAPKDFFRPNLFVNTPDINPVFLQGSGRPGFLIRAALAATLSGLWGVYCGFELCEAASLPGREEYLHSEKYQIRAWDWDRPGNITAEVRALNRIRRHNPALQTHLGLRFLEANNDMIMVYEKITADRSNLVLVAVSLDWLHPQSAEMVLPLWRWGLSGGANADDLVHGGTVAWRGERQRVTLDPASPYAIWRIDLSH